MRLTYAVGALLALLASPALAACPTPLTGKDASGTTQNLSTSDDAGGNCSANITLLDGASGSNKAGVNGSGQLAIAGPVTNAGTFAVQAAQSGTWNITNVSGTVSLPTGAATAAKQPALGTAGSASSDVLSVQGIASMTPLQVSQATAANLNATVSQATGSNLHMVCDSGCSGSGGTSSTFGSAFPSAGTAIGLTNGTNMIAWSATSNYGTSPGAIAVPALNSYVTGGTVVVTQSTTTNLRAAVDPNTPGNWAIAVTGAAVPTNTQQVGGSDGTDLRAFKTDSSGDLTVIGTGTFAVQAAQSGTWNVTNISGTVSLPTGAATSANQTNASQKTQIVDGSGNVIASTSNNLNVQCANCSGSGASAADAATFTAGTSVFAPSGGQFTTGGATACVTGHQCIVGMTAARGFFTDMSSIAGTATATGNGVSGAGTQRVNIASDNTAFAVNATLQASGTTAIGKVDPNTIATWGLATVGAGTAPTNAMVTGCIQASPTPSASQSVALSCDTSGNLKVVGTGITQGSTTSGQTGSLIMGAVTTSAPTYTTAQSSPLSLDTAGNLRVNVVAGGGSGGTSSTFGSAFPGTGTAIGLTNGTNMVAWSATSNYGTAPSAIAVPAVNAAVTNTVAENITQVGGSSLALGSTTASASIPVVLASNQTAADPCMFQLKTNVAISTASGTTALVTGVSAKKIYVCSLFVNAPSTVSVSLSEGSSSTCGTSNQAAVIGVATNGTAANGVALAANGGWTLGNGGGTVASTATAADYLCLFQSGTVQLAGNLTYVQQ